MINVIKEEIEIEEALSSEIRIGFLFKEPQICNDFIEKVLKPKISELFNNVDIVVEHGTKG